jgi:D-3-phosphoglycerate dehydrogenase
MPLKYLEDCGIEVEVKRNHDVNNEEKVAELIGDADAAIVGSDKIGQIVFDECKNLKVISKHGVGLDSIDLEGAKNKGIKVTNTPGANHESVADLTWLLIMAASRDFLGISEYVKRMDWRYPDLGNEVIGKTIGIVGYGRIGRSVAKRAVGFENRVLVYDPMIEVVEPIYNLNIQKVSLKTLLEESDIITLHAPLTPNTQLMLNDEALNKVKPGTIIINTSRGELVDEEALYKALVSGRVKAAALDVFTKEPPIGSPLLTLKNVIATPHLGTHTVESNIRMGMAAAENVVTALKGQA